MQNTAGDSTRMEGAALGWCISCASWVEPNIISAESTTPSPKNSQMAVRSSLRRSFRWPSACA